VRAVGGGVLRGGLEESGEEIARAGAGGGGAASCKRHEMWHCCDSI